MLSVGALEVISRPLGFQIPIVFALLMAYRFFHGLGISTYPAIIADCAEYQKLTKGNPVAFTVGMVGMGQKTASLVRSWVIPAVLAIVGFNASISPEMASHEVRIGVLNMFTMIPGCMTIASGLILLLFYNLKAGAQRGTGDAGSDRPPENKSLNA
jgi:Na+/melibiose symporter-like transporter